MFGQRFRFELRKLYQGGERNAYHIHDKLWMYLLKSNNKEQMSNKNHNTKLKRWKSQIEEFNYELLYKPSRTNIVSDALLKLQLEPNPLTNTFEKIHSANEDNISWAKL